MITINDAEEILKKEYHLDNFLYLVDEILLPDYKSDKHEVVFKNDVFTSVVQLGASAVCDVTVYEVILKSGVEKRRVTITQEMFRILRGQGINNALVAFANADKNNYRISLLTSKYEFDGDKIVKVISNPRRYSYMLGYGTKTKTAYKFLIEKGKVNSLEELTARFSVEVVNKQFYSEIATCFTELVGGDRDGRHYDKMLKLQSVTAHNKYSEFAVRLIGRIVFCWFLKEKKSENGVPLLPESMMSLSGITDNYYHTVLEPLFFELLNTNGNRRKGKYLEDEFYRQIPYLNGGLFSPHHDDLYKYDRVNQCGTFGLVTIPDEWFKRFYGVLSQYNFTVDENTSYDIELSIDPEMLGRIFENLLAEINPETGENAKKSTGSFYTPRDIVDYMVDNSILEYLKSKTGIDEMRLKALISYSKEDDDLAVFDNAEKKAIINALYTVTVLDPACGSGAFPIGMLQKIVYILQQVDPEANLWFDKATENVSILIKKEFEKKFNAGSLDYIRKLSVIQKSIFGVDIQPIAVEIARLRCFLSLIIEEKVYDNEPNRGINPLPSLDFKFIIANSLIPLPSSDRQTTLFENIEHINQLKAIREEYFTADNDRKNELKLEFADTQKQMFQHILATAKIATERYSALFNWSPFKNEPTDWFDPEWMFGVKDGFDIVIANPPYVLIQDMDLSNALSDYYRKGFVVASYKVDLYHLFIERGILLLSNDGIISYITPSNFSTNNYCLKLRKFILENLAIHNIVFYDENVFQANVNNLVFVGQHKKTTGNIKLSKAKRTANDWEYFNETTIEQTFFMREKYLIVPSVDIENTAILDKIDKCSKKLMEYACVNFGMQLRDRKYYPADVTMDKTKLTSDHRPCYTGKNIEKWRVNYSGLYCYFNREAKQGGCWDESVQLANPKILCRQIGVTPFFGIDLHGYLMLNTGFMITKIVDGFKPMALMGILNSKLLKFYWLQKFTDERKQFPKIKGTYIELLPIKRNVQIEERINELVSMIVKLANSKQDFAIYEDEIDKYVYKLYELSDEEIAIVEKSVE